METADKLGDTAVRVKGGDIEDSELISGIIVDKEKVHPGMPVKSIISKL